MDRRQFTSSLLAGASALAIPSLARAQGGGPTRVVVGFAAGGSADTLARLVAEQMQQQLGRTFIVENRTGAAGRLAPEAVMQARPDGETLMIVPHGPMTLFPFIYKKLRFDPVKDFTPVARLVNFDFALVASNAVKADDAKALGRWLQAAGSRANYGSPGAGTVPHFLGVSIAQQLGVPMVHVPYRGAAPAVTDVVGGVLPLAVVPVADAAELAAAGKLRILATSGARRSDALPGVPTFKEFGIDLALPGWYGLYGPAGLPPGVAQPLHQAATAAVTSAALRERLARLGLEPAPAPGPELAAQQQRELAFWRKVVQDSGFTPED